MDAQGEERSASAGAARWLGFRRSAVVEIAVFFAVALLADHAIGAGDGFWFVAPHPFWIIVLLISVQYGTTEGLLAAGVASAALLGSYIPDASISRDIYQHLFDIVFRPLLWAIAAVGFGELRMRQIRERDSLRSRLEQSSRRAQSIAAAYERLDEAKRQLEARVAGQLRTVVSMYKAALAVETMEPARVLIGALDNVRAIMSPEKCSMFVLGANGELQAGIQNGWARRDRYKRRFGADTALYREVIGRGRVLCVVEQADEAILAGEGVLAGPVTNPDTGEVRGMLKIEDLGFLDLNLSSVELFRVLCDWVGAFYANAQRYRKGIEERAIDSDTQLYSLSFLPRHLALMHSLSARAKFDVSVAVLRLDDPYRLSREQRDLVARTLVRAVLEGLRDTDLAFEHDRSGWEYAVVLPMADVGQAAPVAARLVAVFRERLPAGLCDTPLTVGVNALAEVIEHTRVTGDAS